MFKLNLHYPHDAVHQGAVKEIRSSYIPPIGFQIYDPRSAALVVTSVIAPVDDGILGDEINVMLEYVKAGTA
ncbi:hypothetical protein ACFW2V_13630 [Streptomyces sp. NPDC058947]|uniref:hypothetical protein n=1 Tax=Streptomyces sp. NPDC058947 TaxID=3346675 RepID=UPI0036A89B15